MGFILLIIIGMLSGILGSLVGIGGGVVLVPALLFADKMHWISGITPQTAVGASLFAMIFTGLGSTVNYVKYKSVDYRTGILFFIGSFPGAIIGSYINTTLTDNTFYIGFGLLIIALSILMMFKHKLPKVTFKSGYRRVFRKPDSDTEYHYVVPPLITVVIGIAVGAFAGLFGIGGGSLLVPAMMLVLGMPTSVAVGTSLFIIMLVSMTSVTGHILFGKMLWAEIWIIAIGAYIGAYLGSRFSNRVNDKTILFIFRLVLLVVGIGLIREGMN